MKRLFIAVDVLPGKALLDAFEKVQHTLRMEKIHWARTDQMHLTLVFLGDSRDEIVPELASHIETLIRQHHAFDLTLSGLGVFRNIHDPRIIWAGCDIRPEFSLLKSALDKALVKFGHIPDNRPFSPHLTLGRIKMMRHQIHLAQLIGEFRDVIFQSDTVHEVVLYESRLNREGPVYDALKRFELVNRES